MRRHISTVPVKNEKIEARMTVADHEQLKIAADREGLSLSVWVRTALSKAANGNSSGESVAATDTPAPAPAMKGVLTRLPSEKWLKLKQSAAMRTAREKEPVSMQSIIETLVDGYIAEHATDSEA